MSTGGILDKQFSSFVESPTRGLPNAARETTSSLIGANDKTGEFSSAKLNSVGDLNVANRDQFITQSGSLFIEGFRNFINVEFSRDLGQESLDGKLIKEISNNGTATLIPTEGQIEIGVPATASSTSYYRSRNIVTYEPGEMVKGGLTIEISLALQNSEKIEWGYGEDNPTTPSGDIYNGIGWGYDATGLYVFRKKLGSYASKTYQADFNVDKLDGNSNSRFRASGVPVAFNPLNNHIYHVGFEWYGIASPTYYVTTPEGKFIQVHIDQTINSQKGSTIPSPNLPIFVRVENDAIVGRAINLRTGSWQGGIHTARSTISGLDASGVFRNVAVNQYGSLQTSDFLFEIARGFYPLLVFGDKFGRVTNVDTNDVPVDVWNGSGDYTGFNAIENQNLETFSSSANDVGALVTSGSVTSASEFTVTDSTATFITDGVAVGDLFIDDTQGFHGHIREVTSETTITVFFWSDGDNRLNDVVIAPGVTEPRTPLIGDSYRVATTSGTGAAVVQWNNILNEDYMREIDQYVILNGTTPVISTTNCFRLSRGRVIKAGSSGFNQGELTARQVTTTANVFAVMPIETNRTLIAADTVPDNVQRTVFDIGGSISRSGGLAGSANLLLLTREVGGPFQARLSQDLQTGLYYDDLQKKIVVPPRTDIKWRVAVVSDNGTNISAFFKYLDYIQ